MDEPQPGPRLTSWQAALCMVGLLLAMATMTFVVVAISSRGTEPLSFDCLPGDPPADCPPTD